MLLVFPPRAESGGDQERRSGGAVGWSTLTCYWGVRQRCVNWELEPVLSIDPEMRRAGRENVETGGKRTGLGKDSKGRGWGQRDDGEGKKRAVGGGSQQLPSPGLHINELGCPLWAKRGKSLLSIEPAHCVSVWGFYGSLDTLPLGNYF